VTSGRETIEKSSPENIISKSNSNQVSNPISTSGNFKLLSTWGSPGTGDGQFNHPASIENDPNGQRIYIADLDNNRIQVLNSMNFETGENVKVIFRNALHHYNRILEKLKNEKELDFSNPRIQEAIQENIDKNTKMIKKLGSNESFITLDENGKFLCDCLRGYISYLEIAKNTIATKLQETKYLQL
jgi:sulfite reductase alpha subunit-like flavoprotein